jgi:ATP-grasp ribosomal peptide maturase
MTVLVLTHPFDPTADYVVSELNARKVPVFRCDPGEFPQRLSLEATLEAGWVGQLCLPERSISLANVGCVYYRRPTAFDLPASMSGQLRHWAAQEARMGLGGVLSTLPCWLNHPSKIAAAEYKPVQLATARECGLTVPPTLITNNLEAAAKFMAGRTVIYKPFTPVDMPDGTLRRTVFTTPVDTKQLNSSVELTAHLFQLQIDKVYDVRLTVVDNMMFPTRIEGGGLDWRADPERLVYTALNTTPSSVRTGVRRLLKRLGLRFGALDFAVDGNGCWWFLEINPNGQWAFTQLKTGQPIAAAIATALQGGRHLDHN